MDEGDAVLSVNTSVVNAKANQEDDGSLMCKWLPSCCVGVNDFDATSRDSLSFCVLEGLQLISLGRLGDDSQDAGALFLEQATEMWKQRVVSNILIGKVSYESQSITTSEHEKLVNAAMDLARHQENIEAPDISSHTGLQQNLSTKRLKKVKRNSKDGTSHQQHLSRKELELLKILKERDFAKGLEIVETTVREETEKRGEGDLFVAMETKNEAVLHLMRGQNEQATDCFQGYLLAKQKCFGSKSTELLDAFNELGVALYANGEFDDSLSTLNTALALLEGGNCWSSSDSTIPCILNNIGCIHFLKGDSKSALSFLRKALVIQRVIGRSDSACDEQESADLQHNITKLNLSLAKLSGGETHMQETMEQSALVLKSILGDRSEIVNAAQDNVAICRALMKEKS